MYEISRRRITICSINTRDKLEKPLIICSELQWVSVEKELTICNCNGQSLERQLTICNCNGQSLERQLTICNCSGQSLERQLTICNCSGQSLERQLWYYVQNGSGQILHRQNANEQDVQQGN